MTTTAQLELFRTAGGGKLHVRPCPHILGVEVLPAIAEDVAVRDVCTWCGAELAGEGRTYHRTVEEALADMGAAQHAVPELVRLLGLVEYDQVFVPFSRSYVAVSKDGAGVAWAGKTYVDYRDHALVELPDYRPGGGGGAELVQAWGPRCPDCLTARSRNGACGCD